MRSLEDIKWRTLRYLGKYINFKGLLTSREISGWAEIEYYICLYFDSVIPKLGTLSNQMIRYAN